LRRYFILTTKKCRIYAAFGVSQTPNEPEENVKGDTHLYAEIRSYEDYEETEDEV